MPKWSPTGPKTIKNQSENVSEKRVRFLIDFYRKSCPKWSPNGTKREPKGSQNEAKMVHGGHPNAQQRPRDVQERPQATPGLILDIFGSNFDGFLMDFRPFWL